MPEPFDVLAALIRVDRSPNLALAARSLAAAGVPVFPCVVEGKRPLTRRGFLDASSDPEQVAAWWSRTPNANTGIPTGAASGVVVVDVDVHGPNDGRAAFERASEAGLVDGAGLLVRTPTGGAHVYFPATPGREQRSWQAATAGVDFRGDGGYIIAPPSRRIIDGHLKRYEVADIAAHSVGTVDAARLRDFLDPRPVTPPRANDTSVAVDGKRLAAWVAGRGEGERNRGLFWAACRLAENGVSAAGALDALGAAAQSAGLGDREIATTVRSAYRATQPPWEATSGRRMSADRWFGYSASPPSPALGRAGL
ncbi:Primase C terminal 1 (PriCT-1) [Tessaracoccus bendigoensis DSM 12906]|uniref:Primase C terminal 1 (PriCT-1) n=1 Tax=Tessaracoccus bendigoensis DSM 12906 TaxID=1123357 RepID=A0A1M6P341_9ACTN|nr:bifunctional DNA primase/polymerase [Tessaracoccus bendigoensis]SHK02313.1 Primase C terminal 1 (PriCT-1) [Tessaracoccus bendigoensis DSM 12906]